MRKSGAGSKNKTTARPPYISPISTFCVSKVILYDGRGGGRSHLLLASAISPLTTHPVRDRAPLNVLLIETPPTFGCSVRFVALNPLAYLISFLFGRGEGWVTFSYYFSAAQRLRASEWPTAVRFRDMHHHGMPCRMFPQQNN